MERKSFLKKEIEWLLKEKYNGRFTKKAQKDGRKLKKGYPLAYLIGNQPFLNCEIDLKYKPFIPRPETEYWTERVVGNIKKNKKRKIQCLDMFAGSGCVGIAILKNISYAQVDFKEINKKFLKQIKINLEINNINKERYRIIQSDIFKNIDIKSVDVRHLHNGYVKYDYILANPPYIAHNDEGIQLSVKKYEPKRAFYSKNNGLEIIKRFLKDAENYLNENGKIYMEFGHGQKNEITKILKNYGYENYQFFKDQYGKWRWIEINF